MQSIESKIYVRKKTPSAKVAGIAPGAKEQMSLQFEDVVDCLQFHYPDFNFAFLFEHSQGHGRKCDGALHAMHMVLRTYHGGEQPIMSDFIKTKTEWFLGPHLPKLIVATLNPWCSNRRMLVHVLSLK